METEKFELQIKESYPPSSVKKVNGFDIKCYDELGENFDKETVESFGKEWESFHDFDLKELKKLGDQYFDILTPEMVNLTTKAIDFGCGSGRFTKYIHEKVGEIAAIDPSAAIFSASNLLKGAANVKLFKASIDNLPFQDNYFDFGFSLGVLHHIPDTAKAMKDCVSKIKPGGYFLVYLYYNLDNRGVGFKMLYGLSNLFRKGICRLPSKAKRVVCDILAVIFYMPFILFSRVLRFLGVKKKYREKIPLNIYEDKSFYIIRNDSLDRFGTPLEQRFSKSEIKEMMEKSGLSNIQFSEQMPYWHAIGRKK